MSRVNRVTIRLSGFELSVNSKLHFIHIMFHNHEKYLASFQSDVHTRLEGVNTHSYLFANSNENVTNILTTF